MPSYTDIIRGDINTTNSANGLISVSGVVIDDVTKSPIAGVRVQVLNDNRYTAMTNAQGQFTIKLPDFATALYVEAPRYMSQQVAIKSNDESQQVSISLLSNKFKAMYDNQTTYTASKEFHLRGGDVTANNEIQSFFCLYTGHLYTKSFKREDYDDRGCPSLLL